MMHRVIRYGAGLILFVMIGSLLAFIITTGLLCTIPPAEQFSSDNVFGKAWNWSVIAFAVSFCLGMIGQLLCEGFSLDDELKLTNIDLWFLNHGGWE